MGHIRIQTGAGERPELHKVQDESSTEKHEPKSTNPENRRRLRRGRASSSVDTAAVTSDVAAGAQVQSVIPALRGTSGKDAPCPRVPFRPALLIKKNVLQQFLSDFTNPSEYLITNNPKAVSTTSVVLVRVGGIVCPPGFANCVAGVIVAQHAVKFAGGIAYSVEIWLKVQCVRPPPMVWCRHIQVTRDSGVKKSSSGRLSRG